MGKRTVYICDICGSEHSDKRSLSSVSLPVLRDDGYGNESVHHTEREMCEDCRAAYEALLINDFAEIHLDAYGCPTLPVMLKLNADKRYEELLVEHLREVRELEDELERLRDVKDSLFETNFRLTAQLRAMGVVVDEEGEADVEAESLTD